MRPTYDLLRAARASVERDGAITSSITAKLEALGHDVPALERRLIDECAKR